MPTNPPEPNDDLTPEEIEKLAHIPDDLDDGPEYPEGALTFQTNDGNDEDAIQNPGLNNREERILAGGHERSALLVQLTEAIEGETDREKLKELHAELKKALSQAAPLNLIDHCMNVALEPTTKDATLASVVDIEKCALAACLKAQEKLENP